MASYRKLGMTGLPTVSTSTATVSFSIPRSPRRGVIGQGAKQEKGKTHDVRLEGRTRDVYGELVEPERRTQVTTGHDRQVTTGHDRQVTTGHDTSLASACQRV